jgi:membrane fusion protein, copper/silver efflux system
MRWVRGLVLVLVGLGLGWWVRTPSAPAPAHVHVETAQAERWQCPMHPEVVRDGPGTCPICNMKLVKVTPEARIPGKDDSKPSEVDGLGVVTLDPARQQLIGLKTAPVELGPIGASLRTTARVAVDETRVRRVNVKVPGFVEHLFVDFVGKPVRKGQPLYSLYSPELLAAENELLLALRSNEPSMVTASRQKLTQWSVPDAELQRLEREKTAASVVTFNSTVSGVVTSKDIVEGSRVEVGAMPFEVVDLSTVWVLADVYETELRFVAAGQTASLRLEAWPGRTWQGKVLFVDPLLDAKSRTAKVRLSFTNAGGELKPEMFGEVTLAREAREAVRIPSDAVVQSGTQQVVFVSRGEGRFEPRRIETGELGRDFVEVLSGLSVGEAVVTRANFLVDSESRLRASLAAVVGSEAKR